MRGIHRWPVDSPHKEPVGRKMFPFDDVTMSYKIIMLATYLTVHGSLPQGSQDDHWLQYDSHTVIFLQKANVVHNPGVNLTFSYSLGGVTYKQATEVNLTKDVYNYAVSEILAQRFFPMLPLLMINTSFDVIIGFIFCMRPANMKRHYIVMSSPTDWVHTQNNPSHCNENV